MPVQTFAEFEREWPWLTHEEAEFKVTMGDHKMNICDVRETAAGMGYEEWYYSNTIRETESQPMHRSMETLAFQKKTDDDGEGNAVVIKILYYISSGSIVACTFRQKNFPAHVRLEPEFFSTRLGIFPPSEENSDFTKPDALFNPHSEKSYIIFLDVTTRKELEAILADPSSALQKAKGAHQFQRRNGLIWDPPEDYKMGKHFGCFLFDCNLRWHHMNCASGLLWSVRKIDDICYLMEDTLFERGPASLARTRHACGSYCAILGLLMDIGKEHHNAIGYTSTRDAIKMLEGRLTDPVRDYNYGTGFGYACEMKPAFLAAGYGKSLVQLKEHFLGLPADIRLEMLLFFFERTSSRSYGGEGLTMIDHNFKPLWSPLYTRLKSAGLDYSRLFAGENSEEQYCYRYGLYHPPHDEDEEGNESDGTVATETSGDSSEGDGFDGTGLCMDCETDTKDDSSEGGGCEGTAVCTDCMDI